MSRPYRPGESSVGEASSVLPVVSMKDLNIALDDYDEDLDDNKMNKNNNNNDNHKDHGHDDLGDQKNQLVKNEKSSTSTVAESGDLGSMLVVGGHNHPNSVSAIGLRNSEGKGSPPLPPPPVMLLFCFR